MSLAQSQIDTIIAACQRHHVASLHRTYFALLNELRQDLGSPVDLVIADAVRNPYIRKTIKASKQQLYAA